MATFLTDDTFDYENFENEIAARLVPLVDQFDTRIEKFPDIPSDSPRPQGNRVLVGFKRETFSQPNRIDSEAAFIQPLVIEFELTFQTKTPRNRPGITQIMATARTLLAGFSFSENFRPLYQTAGGFVDFDRADSVWTYSQTYAADTLYRKTPEKKLWQS